MKYKYTLLKGDKEYPITTDEMGEQWYTDDEGVYRMLEWGTKEKPNLMRAEPIDE